MLVGSIRLTRDPSVLERQHFGYISAIQCDDCADRGSETIPVGFDMTMAGRVSLPDHAIIKTVDLLQSTRGRETPATQIVETLLLHNRSTNTLIPYKARATTPTTTANAVYRDGITAIQRQLSNIDDLQFSDPRKEALEMNKAAQWSERGMYRDEPYEYVADLFERTPGEGLGYLMRDHYSTGRLQSDVNALSNYLNGSFAHGMRESYRQSFLYSWHINPGIPLAKNTIHTRVRRQEPIVRSTLQPTVTNVPLDVSSPRGLVITHPELCSYSPPVYGYAAECLNQGVYAHDLSIEFTLSGYALVHTDVHHLVYRYHRLMPVTDEIVAHDLHTCESIALDSVFRILSDKLSSNPTALLDNADLCCVRIEKSYGEEGLITVYRPDSQEILAMVHLDFAYLSLCSLGVTPYTDALSPTQLVVSAPPMF